MTTAVQPYASMDAMRHAYDDMLTQLPKPSADEAGKSDARIDEFISRAIATGRILDTVGDRREAQGLIDYWVASAYTKPRRRGGAATGRKSIEVDDSRARWSDSQLEDFDQTVIDAAAGAADGFLGKLSNHDKELARRILFQLIAFPDAGDSVSLASASVDELRKFGDPRRVDAILDGLKGAGILSVRLDEDGKEVAALHYLALARKWSWFNGEIKKRMNFRELASSWVGSGRASGALVGWSITRQFRKYSNLNQWETDFVNRSARFNFWSLFILLGGASVLLASTVWGPDFYEDNYATRRAPAIRQQILDSKTRALDKVDDIKWLARYRQKIELPGLDLSASGEKDLSGLFAAGAIFNSSKLVDAQFENARLAGTSFSSSAIKGTSFKAAYLYRASFDRVDFCGGVTFSAADVYEASFRQVQFVGDIPDFSNAAWWLAFGWTFDQIEILAKKFPKKDQKLPKLDTEIIRTNNLVASAEKGTNVARADAYNEMAWTFAYYGYLAEKSAEDAARKGLGLLNENTQAISEAKSRARLSDTLAYILMQNTDVAPAQQQQNLQEALSLLSKSEKLLLRDERFRYAIALHAVNRDKDAEDALKTSLVEQQYLPSHELYLLSHYMDDYLKMKILELTKSAPGPQRPQTCDQLKSPGKPLSTTGAASR